MSLEARLSGLMTDLGASTARNELPARAAARLINRNAREGHWQVNRVSTTPMPEAYGRLYARGWAAYLRFRAEVMGIVEDTE